MLSPADRIIEATMPHTLRPKRGNREKVIAAALEFVIEEYGYYVWDFGYDSKDIIDVKDLQELIDELKSTVTLEKPAQDPTNPPVDAL
jgi:hypothetical protein